MVVITKARTLADFYEAHALIAEMGRWDVAQCDALGLPSEDVISAYYSDDVASLLEMCTLPNTGMYLAQVGSVVLGCIGHVSRGDVPKSSNSSCVRKEEEKAQEPACLRPRLMLSSSPSSKK
ncbi:hypothetical protein WGT02_15205 [Rhizobium sp. T1470]|uniref:Uncharacterized protein n=1 Tax=Rhizobium favelukesii TaxID=348824 RepID=W6RB71_9HYPH|nr:hypothetical protein LPU83_2861 [Rhizobium favelukesii]